MLTGSTLLRRIPWLFGLACSKPGLRGTTCLSTTGGMDTMRPRSVTAMGTGLGLDDAGAGMTRPSALPRCVTPTKAAGAGRALDA
ncbi:hypothetical protein [Komagataeibacter xylinus]|uniref:Uncharacterized protein n=1 Tax=Komagataeibacter xylinus TaxID=28448 RepID=A0A857FQI6_KOMXY|nr:hypothetical protein [Komagataeibacter xylinus]QHC36426.1 hypothetical protein FMA36_13785 [Komagataeibacter xylinus]